DHIGGLIEVLQTYQIGSVLETKMQNDSQTFKKLEETIASKQIEKIEAKKGVALNFSAGAKLEILYPLETVINANSKDTNLASVVAKLTVGENSFLLTGDFPTTQDAQLLASGQNLSANFLKVAHHGSKYATSDGLLNAIKPNEAIISVGKKNSYGHPNPEVLQRLLSRKVKIFRTDEVGDIVYECQKEKLTDAEIVCQHKSI
ncbi:MAG: MBL fold metallo-hydrolase, partial [Candidatus Moraniibacteriota bacterium]